MHRYLRLLLAMAVAPAGAQAEPQGGGEALIYVATYIEVMPTAASNGTALLRQYRDASRKESGNLRLEVGQEANRPNRFVVLAIWTDQNAFDAHGKGAHAVQFRDQLKAIRIAPEDQRVHSGMSVGAGDAAWPDGLLVVTHVDVPPPSKDVTVPLLKQLAEASRSDTGNLRFEVLQQSNRPNHFTVVEIWAGERAHQAHVTASHTEQFRETLGPMSGALYDDRLYRVLD